jgi:hypothetical protein
VAATMKATPSIFTISEILSIDTGSNAPDNTLLLLLLAARSAKKSRKRKWLHERTDWSEHARMKVHQDRFQTEYHMSFKAFNKLVDILRPSLAVNVKQSMCSSTNDPIHPEIAVAAGLRYLGGELVKSIADIFHMSYTTTFKKIEQFLVAVDSNDVFNINVPTTPHELKECANGWSNLSSAEGIYDGCIGAIDGWLCCINAPKEVDNKAHYYSGHYQRYGLNVQAVCDSNLRFIYFGIVAPGRTNDARAFSTCIELRKWLDNLPDEYFLVGDNAYTLTKSMLIPFSGSQRSARYNLIKVGLICQVAAKLHNYVIDEDNIRFGRTYDSPQHFEIQTIETNTRRGLVIRENGYFNTLPRRSEAYLVLNDDRRKQIVDEISSRMLERPSHNTRRNLEYDEESVYEEPADN